MANLVNKIEKLDDLPSRENPKHNYDSRYYNRSDYPYKRVERWLLASVGRRFDDVTAEFVTLPWIPAKRRTFRQLSAYHVETHTFVNDNKELCFFDRYYAHTCEGFFKIKEYYSDLFYVHPITKLLCFAKAKKTNWTKIYKEREAKTFRILDDYRQLLKLNGIWYEIKGEPIGKNASPNKRMIIDDTNKFPQNNPFCLPTCFSDEYVKITYKKQLSSKELKKHGVQNDIKIFKKCPKCGKDHCLIHKMS